MNKTKRILTGPGQINVGDEVSFTLGSSSTVVLATAAKILHAGSGQEAVVYNLNKNHYFITAMTVNGTSNHKNVSVTPCALTLALEWGFTRAAQPESLTPQIPHQLFTDLDLDKPKQICDRNGQVVLSQCKNCGLAECELTDAPWCKPKRTLLEEFDLDQSPEYHKGREDGRAKGYEVGYRHATERLAQAVHPTALKNLLQKTLDALENSSNIVFMDLKKASLREESIAALQAAITQSEQPTHNHHEASRDAAVVTLEGLGYAYFGVNQWRLPIAQTKNLAEIQVSDAAVGTFERQYLVEKMPTRKALELFLKRQKLAAVAQSEQLKD